MIKQIAALALAGSISLGFASPSAAHHTTQQPYNEQQLNGLVYTVKVTGHKVYTASPACQNKKGLFGAATRNKQLLICVENHDDDRTELADTVRHESIHLAQFCKGRNVGTTVAMLHPADSKKYLQFAVDFLHMPLSRYSEQKHYTEAEARVLAYLLEEKEVAQLLVEYCINGKK